jgi:hypothetical protein
MASWNDGVSKQLSEYFEQIGEYGEFAIEAIQEQIDLETEKLVSQLEQTTPRGPTLGLLNSLRKSKITVRHNWYGYSVEFEGENRKGVPYQKIANILNYGTSTIKGTRFINKAIRNLKDMDERIYNRFQNKIKL